MRHQSGALKCACGIMRYRNFMQPRQRAIDGGKVHIDNMFALFGVGFVNRRFDFGNRLIARQDV